MTQVRCAPTAAQHAAAATAPRVRVHVAGPIRPDGSQGCLHCPRELLEATAVRHPLRGWPQFGRLGEIGDRLFRIVQRPLALDEVLCDRWEEIRMPRLRGPHTLLGVTDGPASIDGTPLPIWAGLADWVDDDHVVCQTTHAGAFTAAVYDVRTGAVAPPHLPPRAVVQLAGGAGRWIAADDRGVYGALEREGFSLGLTDEDGRGSIAPDGTIAIVRHGGRGFVLVPPAGEEIVGPDVEAIDLQVLGAGVAIWRDRAGRIDTLGISRPLQLPTASKLRAVRLDGRWYLLSFCGALGLVVHPWDSLVGVRLTGVGVPAFYPHVEVVDGRLVVAYSSGPAEEPGDVVRVDDVLARPRVDLASLLERDEPEPEPVSPPIATIIEFPTRVRTGEAATCTSRLSGGPATRAIWRWRRVGESAWRISVLQAPPFLAHSYVFHEPGAYEISLRVEGPGGADETLSRRQILVESEPILVEPDDVVPAPAALPTRSTFLVGVCWPTADDNNRLPADRLTQLRLLGLRALRFDLHHANPHAGALIDSVAMAGLRPWPILLLTPDAEDFDHELATFAVFCEQLARRYPWLTDLEVGNEPMGIGRLSADRYARMCIVAGDAIRRFNPAARIYLSADGMMTHVDRSAPRAYFLEVQRRVASGLYDGLAVHPYRTPRPWHETAWGSREAEWAEAQRRAGAGKILAVTEVGWTDRETGAEAAATNLTSEIHSGRLAGVTAAFIYAYATPAGVADDWGLFVADGETWTPARKAEALAHYLQEHPLS